MLSMCLHETWCQDNNTVFMSDMAEKFPPPKGLSFTGNLSGNWNKWKTEFNLYLTATEAHDKSNEVKSSRLLTAVGEKARDVYYTFTFDNEEDSMKLDVVLKKFDEYMSPKKNIYMKYKFFAQGRREGGGNLPRGLYLIGAP